MLKIYLLILILIIGIVLIIKGGDFVVTVCGKLSDLTGVHETIIGATVTSFATTLPELIITVLGMSQNSEKLVLGNTFGTVLVNTCLVLGISLLSMRLLRINKKTLNKLLFMIILILVISLLVLFKILNFVTGIILIVVFFIYLLNSYFEVKKNIQKNFIVENKEKSKAMNKRNKIQEIIKFFVGLLLIFAGAQLVVNVSENISVLLTINSTIIGLIVLAIGTSLPELITSITSIKKKRLNLAIGNVIGANIINLSLLIGIASIISGFNYLTLSVREISIILPTLLISAVILGFPMFIRKRTYRWQGITLLSLYAIYCIFIILIL